MGLEPALRMYACMKCGALTNRATALQLRIHDIAWLGSQKFLFLKCFLKFLTKISVKKTIKYIILHEDGK